MLDSGLPAQRIQVLALDPNTPAAQQLQQQGHSIVEGDLDNPDSLHAVLRGVGAVYIHALANDAGGSFVSFLLHSCNCQEEFRGAFQPAQCRVPFSLAR